jgi:PAS domain-containing protein
MLGQATQRLRVEHLVGQFAVHRVDTLMHNPRMSQRDVGLILMRQLADGMAVPVLLADSSGELLFFNEPAERLLGQRLDDMTDMPLAERRRLLLFRDSDGNPLPDDQAPLVVALREHRPVHRRVFMRGQDGREHEIEVTSFPLLGGGGHLIGGVSMFWERKSQA